jgi:hypothetical protein
MIRRERQSLRLVLLVCSWLWRAFAAAVLIVIIAGWIRSDTFYDEWSIGLPISAAPNFRRSVGLRLTSADHVLQVRFEETTVDERAEQVFWAEHMADVGIILWEYPTVPGFQCVDGLADDQRNWGKPTFRHAFAFHDPEAWAIVSRGPMPGQFNAIRYCSITFPHWAAALPLAMLYGWMCLRPWWRRRRERQLGCCANCGYDLRATPDRCPECGACTRALPG